MTDEEFEEAIQEIGKSIPPEYRQEIMNQIYNAVIDNIKKESNDDQESV